MTKEFWFGKEIGKREAMNRAYAESKPVISALELYEKYGVIKSISEDGTCKVQLDLDDFKEIFAISERQRFLTDMLINLPDEERKRIPFKVMQALEYLLQDNLHVMMCYHILRGECRFDMRNKKEP